MALFDPDAHEPLTRSGWDARRAQSTIQQIVERTLEAFQPGRFWSRHPLGEYGSASDCDKGLSIGAAGVRWALDRLDAGIGEAGVYDAHLSGAPLSSIKPSLVAESCVRASSA